MPEIRQKRRRKMSKHAKHAASLHSDTASSSSQDHFGEHPAQTPAQSSSVSTPARLLSALGAPLPGLQHLGSVASLNSLAASQSSDRAPSKAEQERHAKFEERYKTAMTSDEAVLSKYSLTNYKLFY